MFKTIIVLLVCALAAGAERYSDYDNARMPQYSMEDGNRDSAPLREEYADRSPDAPAPFDYKYEEDLRDKKDPLRIKVEDESWHKPSNKLKEATFTYDDEIEPEHESVSKFKANRRNRKHRTRIKNKNFDSNSGRRETKYVRSRKISKDDVDSSNDYYDNKGYVREDNSIDSDNLDFEVTTQKVIRRKPRDRTTNHNKLGIQDVENDEDTKRFRSEDDTEDVDNPSEERKRFKIGRPHSVPEISKLKYKDYPEHEYYDDMKRVNNMKNRLPDLLRKTQASTTQTAIIHLQDTTHRRANYPENATESRTTTIAATETSVVIRTSETVTPNSNRTELSLAEKSRLSILRKAQRKDNIRNVTWTTKPPVLMLVTRGMQTLVMVESQPDVKFRAREVFDDSPERVARAKKLMRRKLVAGARSIQDLTDNWDEMICDYIDVSLLENEGSSLATVASTLQMLYLSILRLQILYSCDNVYGCVIRQCGPKSVTEWITECDSNQRLIAFSIASLMWDVIDVFCHQQLLAVQQASPSGDLRRCWGIDSGKKYMYRVR